MQQHTHLINNIYINNKNVEYIMPPNSINILKMYDIFIFELSNDNLLLLVVCAVQSQEIKQNKPYTAMIEVIFGRSASPINRPFRQSWEHIPRDEQTL